MKDQILHASLLKESLVLMASDMTGPDGFINGNTIALSLNCSSEKEIRTFFSNLSSGGQISQQLEEQFWGATFGVLTDKYGTRWMLNYDKKLKNQTGYFKFINSGAKIKQSANQILNNLKKRRMKIVKKILIVVIIIIAIRLIIALFIKKEYSIQREITINKPQQEVFNYVKYLKNQDNYSKWVMTDPAMKKDFRGTDGTEGFVYAWDSKNKNAGKGEQEITKITEGKRLDIEVRFEKPFEGIATTPIETEAISENQTKVKWGMNGKSKYPMNFMNLFMDNMSTGLCELGKDLEISLTNLKGILEK